MTQYYVTTTGSDSNNGQTTATAWLTMSKAVSVAAAGDVVNVADGTYNIGTLSWSSSGTSAGARITLRSINKWGAALVGIVQPHGNWIAIQDFDVSNPSGSQGIETNGSNQYIAGNRIHDIPGGCPSFGGAGIHTYGASTSNVIESNLVYNIDNSTTASCQLTHGIYLESFNDLVQNNIVHNTQGWGILGWHAFSNGVIIHNTVFHNKVGGILIGNGDILAGDRSVAESCVVANNISIDNGFNGGRHGIDEDGTTGTHNIYANNITYNNTPSNYSLQNGLVATGSITTDAAFVNYLSDGTGNYHLLTASPAINAAASISGVTAPTTDYDGTARTAIADIGALEFTTPGSANASTILGYFFKINTRTV